MGDNDDQDQGQEQAEDPGTVRRTTPHGDELTEEHAIGEREERAARPYAPPRQPSQDPPGS